MYIVLVKRVCCVEKKNALLFSTSELLLFDEFFDWTSATLNGYSNVVRPLQLNEFD